MKIERGFGDISQLWVLGKAYGAAKKGKEDLLNLRLRIYPSLVIVWAQGLNFKCRSEPVKL